MTTYYVDPVNGADTNNGLGPDASAVTNKPWKTLSKVLLVGGVAAGDTVYLAPGTFREAVTIGIAPASLVAIIGDPQNKQGFKDSSGVAVGAGPVMWSAYTSGDKTAPTTTLLNLNGRSNFSFQYINFIQGNGVVILGTTTTPQNYTFTDCSFQGYFVSSNAILSATAASGGATPLNWLIDRCLFIGRGIPIQITCNQSGSGSGDNDINFVVKNSIFFSFNTIFAIASTSSTGAKAGGGVFRNNTIYGSTAAISTAVGWSTAVPAQFQNNFVISGGAALAATTSGQIVEDYNLIQASTARTNVTVGTHSIADGSYAFLFHFGQERIWSGFQRRFFEPIAGSPLLGFGNDGNQTSYDERNNPRPAGGLSALPAVGALERSNTWGQETVTVHGGSNALACIGPGYQDFLVPVDGTSTTVTVYLRYDSNYAGTLPQLQLLQNDELGLSAQTVTHTGSVNTWQQVSLTFTASKAGFVTLRLLSNDTAGYGRALADDFAFS